MEELSDVQSLKEHLQTICGLPPRFRQKLLHHGEALEDDVALDSPIDVNLIVNASARPPRLAGLPTVGTCKYRYTGI